MITAVIPTRYHPPELAVLLDVLAGDGIEAIVLESADFDHRIYQMWNAGRDRASEAGASTIAILNDDIAIRPGALRFMADVLDDYPSVGVVYPDVTADWDAPVFRGIEPTTGTWGAGGMTGFCFMFRAGLPVCFDEAFGWWFGDDAFEADVRALGLSVARVTGVPIRHTPNGSSSRDWDRLAPLVDADQALWNARVVDRERPAEADYRRVIAYIGRVPA